MPSIEEDYPKYVKFDASGLDCKSTDANNPNELNLEIIYIDTFDSEYSTNTKVKLDGEEVVLPLKNKNSKNEYSFNIWTRNIAKDVIVARKKIKLLTCLLIFIKPYENYVLRMNCWH